MNNRLLAEIGEILRGCDRHREEAEVARRPDYDAAPPPPPAVAAGPERVPEAA